MAISLTLSWGNGEESLDLSLETDLAGYNPDVADDMARQLNRGLKEAINDPTVTTPRPRPGDGLEGATQGTE